MQYDNHKINSIICVHNKQSNIVMNLIRLDKISLKCFNDNKIVLKILSMCVI